VIFIQQKFVAIASVRTTGMRVPSSDSSLSIHGVSWRSPPRSPALGRASHRDTKTRRKVPARNADVLVGIIASLRFQLCLLRSRSCRFGLPAAGSVGSHSSQNVSPYGLLLCSLPRKSPICLVPSQRPLACVQVSGFQFQIFSPPPVDGQPELLVLLAK